RARHGVARNRARFEHQRHRLLHAAQGLDPSLLEGAGAQLCTHFGSEKQKPRLDGCGALLAARSEAVSVKDTVQPGLGNRVQSIVEMNREDIRGISVMRALSWAPSAMVANDAGEDASVQAAAACCVASHQQAHTWSDYSPNRSCQRC